MDAQKPKEVARSSEQTPGLEYTLRDVRAKFGFFIASGPVYANSAGDIFTIGALSHGSKGPQKEDWIELNLDPHQARRIYKCLKREFEKREDYLSRFPKE